MAKAKKKSSKSSFLSKTLHLSNPKVGLAVIIVIGFGAFGVYKLALSSAATSLRVNGCTASGFVGKFGETGDRVVGFVNGQPAGNDNTVSPSGEFSFRIAPTNGRAPINRGTRVSIEFQEKVKGGGYIHKIGSVTTPQTCSR